MAIMDPVERFSQIAVRPSQTSFGAWKIDDGAAGFLKLARKVDASIIGTPRILRRYYPK